MTQPIPNINICSNCTPSLTKHWCHHTKGHANLHVSTNQVWRLVFRLQGDVDGGERSAGHLLHFSQELLRKWGERLFNSITHANTHTALYTLTTKMKSYTWVWKMWSEREKGQIKKSLCAINTWKRHLRGSQTKGNCISSKGRERDSRDQMVVKHKWWRSLLKCLGKNGTKQQNTQKCYKKQLNKERNTWGAPDSCGY